MQLPHRSREPVAPEKLSPTASPDSSDDISPPPPYTSATPYTANEAPPDISAAFSNLRLEDSTFPTSDQCIAHLKLLEAFHQLREDVALRDGLFGLNDAFVPNHESNEAQAEILRKIREKRWAVFVAKAVQRFEKWWTVCVQPQAKRLTQSSGMTSKPTEGTKLRFRADDLPPIGENLE